MPTRQRTAPRIVAPATKTTSTTPTTTSSVSSSSSSSSRATSTHLVNKRKILFSAALAVMLLVQSATLVEADDPNPQQTTASEQQILDRDTYGGRTPDATYWYQDDSQEALSSPDPFAAPSNKIDSDIRHLAESMSLKELAGQMTQIQIGMLIGQDGELDLEKVQYWIGEWGVGSFLDTPTK